ncbi:MAG: NnrS family protein [Alphaproteobacteria bacterium]|nr:MAG: NnrS family protein [Alphaproteobacteria bacterium]
MWKLGMRPFFLLAAIWAGLAVPLWIAILFGIAPAPGEGGLDPLAWHRHAMIFGYTSAALAGFLLTAVPNWTASTPLAGRPLIGLVGIWIAARLANAALWWWGHHAPAVLPGLAILLDAGFYLLLALWAGRRILLAHNRNLPLPVLLLLLASASAWDLLAAGTEHAPFGLGADIGWRAGLAVMVMLIALIGGRITPAFTRNWLKMHGNPRAEGVVMTTRADVLVLLATAIGLGLWVAQPFSGLTGFALIMLGIAHVWRLSRWQGLSARPEPLLFILHLGMGWLAIGFLLEGSAILLEPASTSVALHAWTAGAIGTMTLAVMSRAALGHSGRPLVADRALVAMFTAVNLAVLARLSTGLWPAFTDIALMLAAAAWTLAFLIFLARFTPLLWQP